MPTFHIRDFRKPDLDPLWRIDQHCFAPGIAYSREELEWYITRRHAFTLVAERAGKAGEPDLRGEPAARGPRGSSAERGPSAVGSEATEIKNSHIIAFLVADRDRRGNGHITTLDVLPQARRSGLGSELMRLAEERLRAAGCPAMTLETAVDNVTALTFYQRLGYTVVRTLPRYYHNAVDGLLLQKPLAAPAAR